MVLDSVLSYPEIKWSQVRLAKPDVIGMSLVKSSSSSLEVVVKQPNIDCLSLLDALEVYLEQKGKGRPKTFRVAAERSCNYLIGQGATGAGCM